MKPNRFTSPFQVINSEAFEYIGQELTYYISGQIPQNPTLLEFDFLIHSEDEGIELNIRLDLCNETQTKSSLYTWTENHALNYAQIILELGDIKTELESRRPRASQSKKGGFSSKVSKQATTILQSRDLIPALNNLLGQSGIIGNEQVRLLLYLIGSSYKFKYNLHAVIHAEDAMDSRDLITKIARLIPEEDRYQIDLTTSRSFRYYRHSTIDHKLIVIPDYSGIIGSKAISDLKRLQAEGQLINDAPIKDKHGFLTTVKQEVPGHCSSIGACSNSKKYFDNEPRTLLICMDNDSELAQKRMEQHCLDMAGLVNHDTERQAADLLQHIIRQIHPLPVINPHALALMLPPHINHAPALTRQLLNLSAIITLFHQHQRQKNESGQVIATTEDNAIAVNLFLDTVTLQIDELDPKTRQFLLRLEAHLLKLPQKKATRLTSLDIQAALDISKSHANRFLKTLVDQNYLQKHGQSHTGFTYQVKQWDAIIPLKRMIKEKLSNDSGGSSTKGSLKATGNKLSNDSDPKNK